MAVRYNTFIPTSNLQLLLDAANPRSYSGSGTTWTDISGKGKNFTWNSTPAYTAAGPASYFTTTGKACSGAASNSFGINNGTGYTVIMFSKTLIDEANAAFQWWGDGYDNRGFFLHPGWSNNTMYFDQGGCCDANQRLQVTYNNNETKSWSVWAFRSRLYDRSQFCNGVRTGHDTTYAANINLNSGAAYICGGNWTAQLNFFALFNTGLDDNTIFNISRALRSRFE